MLVPKETNLLLVCVEIKCMVTVYRNEILRSIGSIKQMNTEYISCAHYDENQINVSLDSTVNTKYPLKLVVFRIEA